ncbi:MAG: 5'-3' exonuclease [Victivallales bacterium]|nr:5'-3' exonuclease [Victivallales bacterium]
MEDTMYLIDAYAQIYRGYYALPLMSSSKGDFSNAVFAFSRFLLLLEKDFSPRYGAVVYDLGRPEARLSIYPDYKATRAPMPEELRQQLPALRSMIAAFGYPVLEHEKVEADDLIAALAANFADFAVRIVSSDKDIAQTVDGRVEMLVPQSGGKGLERRGVNEVIQKFGVMPEQIADYLAMIGDTSDNVPGLPGVGPKTAAKLIGQFGSVEAMLRGRDQIASPSLREKVASSSEILRRNIELIRLDTKLPDPSWSDIATVRKKNPEWAKIKDIANGLDMKSFLRDVEDHLVALGERDEASLKDSAQGAEAEQPKPTSPTEKLYTPDMFD